MRAPAAARCAGRRRRASPRSRGCLSPASFRRPLGVVAGSAWSAASPVLRLAWKPLSARAISDPGLECTTDLALDLASVLAVFAGLPLSGSCRCAARRAAAMKVFVLAGAAGAAGAADAARATRRCRRGGCRGRGRLRRCRRFHGEGLRRLRVEARLRTRRAFNFRRIECWPQVSGPCCGRHCGLRLTGASPLRPGCRMRGPFLASSAARTGPTSGNGLSVSGASSAGLAGIASPRPVGASGSGAVAAAVGGTCATGRDGLGAIVLLRPGR